MSYTWENFSDEALLKLRFCDLRLDIAGSRVEKCVQKLQVELAAKGLKFKPSVWVSSGWFTPNGIAGFAIPFYMLHPRLAALEKSQLHEVEGGSAAWCMQLIRHECGHAIENAYQLRRRRTRQTLFGKSGEPYKPYYTPKPYSKKFVQHLVPWYAQSHPDEDFAETFAVWLTPRSNWRRRYAEWGALAKLNYIDDVMKEIAGAAPRQVNRNSVDPLNELTQTLGSHYRRARAYYRMDSGGQYSANLRTLFRPKVSRKSAPKAARFLRGVRREAREAVSRDTGLYQYTVDQVIQEMIEEVKVHDWSLVKPLREAKKDFLVILSKMAVRYAEDSHSGYPR